MTQAMTTIKLLLYVAGDNDTTSTRARRNLENFCAAHVHIRWQVRVIDTTKVVDLPNYVHVLPLLARVRADNDIIRFIVGTLEGLSIETILPEKEGDHA